jgi:catechol 2,3-dioxygenase-like lactoylglutathione lyase family enzyme
MAGFAPHTFFLIAGKRIGAYLQSAPRPPSRGVRGAPTFSFETSPAGLRRIAAELARCGLPHEFADSIYFNDPAGNHLHAYVPRLPSKRAHVNGALEALGYVRLEAPDLRRSLAFYTDTFDLTPARLGDGTGQHTGETALTLGSGQLLFLSEGPLTPRGIELGWDVPGPHLAFVVPRDSWDELCSRLDRLGIEHGDVAAESKGRTATERATYLCDPAGYRIQLLAGGDHE